MAYIKEEPFVGCPRR